MARMKFLCDADRCIECNACVTACKNEHDIPWGIIGGASLPSMTASRASARSRWPHVEQLQPEAHMGWR
jgi:Fe-S-cluster-containing dehydrogenase component